MSCNAELRGFGAFHEEFRRLGVTLAAVSVDSPQQSRKVVERRGLPFPVLADQERTLIDALGLVHVGGGPGGSDIAIPAHVLVDRQGRILWRYVSDKVQNRLDPRVVLDHVRSAITP